MKRQHTYTANLIYNYRKKARQLRVDLKVNPKQQRYDSVKAEAFFLQHADF